MAVPLPCSWANLFGGFFPEREPLCGFRDWGSPGSEMQKSDWLEMLAGSQGTDRWAQPVHGYLPVGGSGDTGMLKEAPLHPPTTPGSVGGVSFTGARVAMKVTATVMACAGMYLYIRGLCRVLCSVVQFCLTTTV